MYFSETPSLREIEKTMKMIPNFTPRGHGVVILCQNEFAEENCIGVSQKEILEKTMSHISNPLFQKRFKKYINESETIPMNFRNSKHNITFTDTIRKKNKKDYALTEFNRTFGKHAVQIEGMVTAVIIMIIISYLRII